MTKHVMACESTHLKISKKNIVFANIMNYCVWQLLTWTWNIDWVHS